MQKIQRVKGMRDFLPEEMYVREWIFNKIKETYEAWGFQPLETPALEYFETMKQKGAGGEAIKDEIYVFKDKADREVALRYDLTVPLARVIVMNAGMTFPFKRYHIGRVWRYDNPQAGRYREFWQADVDIIGVKDVLADAYVVATGLDALENIGIKKYELNFNSRKALDEVVKIFEINNKDVFFRILDKMDKIGENGVLELMEKENINNAKEILSFLKKGSVDELSEKTKEELFSFKDYLTDYGFNSKLNLSIVRGLDYYTGLVFETFSPLFSGSIASGGRYDNMIKLFSDGKLDFPATGFSLGVERILYVLNKEKEKTKTKLYIYIIKGNEKEGFLLSRKLRELKINVETSLGEGIKEALDYCNKKAIPFFLVLGEKEIRDKKCKIKNLKKYEEVEVDLSPEKIKETIINLS